MKAIGRAETPDSISTVTKPLSESSLHDLDIHHGMS